MIYVKPRKKLNVTRMRKQREKHHPTRYMVWYFDRRTMDDMHTEVQEFVMAELQEEFKRDVMRWNFSRKATLGPVVISRDYDIDFDRIKILFEIRRLPKGRNWWDVMARMSKDKILTPNEIRMAFGLPPHG